MIYADSRSLRNSSRYPMIKDDKSINHVFLKNSSSVKLKPRFFID